MMGFGFMLGMFGTGVMAVAVTGTIKTWTANEKLTASDLNTTIASLKTAIESIPNWTKNGTSAYYNDGNVGIGTSNPGNKLQVNGNMSSYTDSNNFSVLGNQGNIELSSTGDGQFIDFKNSGSKDFDYRIIRYNNPDILSFVSGNKTNVSFQSDGSTKIYSAGRIVINLTPNAYNTITHNKNIPCGLIFATNSNANANQFSVRDATLIDSNSFKFFASGGSAVPADIGYLILCY